MSHDPNYVFVTKQLSVDYDCLAPLSDQSASTAIDAGVPSGGLPWTAPQGNLRAAFPGLPVRSQLNRLIRGAHDTLVAFGQALIVCLGTAEQTHELLGGMRWRCATIDERGAAGRTGLPQPGGSIA